MHIVVLGNGEYRDEWPQSNQQVRITWVSELEEFSQHRADAYIDLAFDMDAERIRFLKSLASLVVVNSVAYTLGKIGAPFVRINAWPTFLKREMIECCVNDETAKQKAQTIFTALGKKAKWVPDTVGMITARVVAMIINEAYHAYGEGVSSKAEIDTAMKLGTNYPFGPFEWATRIGLRNVHTLLTELAGQHDKYLPAPALQKEATV